MTVDDLRKSLTATDPPAGLTHALAGLWWHAKGDWKRAHTNRFTRNVLTLMAAVAMFGIPSLLGQVEASHVWRTSMYLAPPYQRMSVNS